MIKDKDYKIHFENLESIKGIKGVYLLRNLDTGKLKIGTTNNVRNRLNAIRRSFKFCGAIPKLQMECFIEYEYSLELEKFLHKELKEFNHQNEWFNIFDINITLNKLNSFEHKESIIKEMIENKIYDEDAKESKLTEAKIRAKKKWAEKNKYKTKYTTNKSVTKIFITSQLELKDYEDIKEWLDNRYKELNKKNIVK